MTSDLLTLRRVARDGSVSVLGAYDHRRRMLRLEAPGWPFLPPGEHPVEGDLPWLFEDMVPSGFRAREIAAKKTYLKLPSDPRLWSDAHKLSVLTSPWGADLPGNMIIGDSAFEWSERLRSLFHPRLPLWKTSPERTAFYGILAAGKLQSADEHPSSLGGERPKMGITFRDGAGLLVKFTPPVNTEAGRRWADLLRMEAHCAGTLRKAGLSAVEAQYVESQYVELDSAAAPDGPTPVRRGYLEVPRFDRVAGFGRIGAATLFHLGASLYGEVVNPVRIVERLVADGQLDETAADTVRLAHAFSQAIGNNDAHCGNYGLVFDDHGRAELAPLYDILPMVFAPRHDEVPDPGSIARGGARALSAAAQADPRVSVLVDRLAERVRSDEDLSPPFRSGWLRLAGRE